MNNKGTLISNGIIYTPTGVIENGWLLVEGRSITHIGAGSPPGGLKFSGVQEIDAGHTSVLPGFIDLHVHGAMGHEIMDATPEAVQKISQFLASRGVTSFVGATWTADFASTLKALQNMLTCYGRTQTGATLLGSYLEGPYLNPNRAGAQSMGQIRSAAEHTEALRFLDNGLVKVVCLAPEYPENIWLVDECVRRGITVAAGHTNARYEEMLVAVSHGVRLLTHCFNAMSPLHHRHPGVVGAALALPELRCELIADNIHVHPVVQKILFQAKGMGGINLVSDSVRMTGLEPGEYILDGRPVVLKDGTVRLEDGTLAGSVLTMDRALVNFMEAARRPLSEAWQATSLNPARTIGIAHQKGSLETGHDADIVILDEQMQVTLTMVEGRIVHST